MRLTSALKRASAKIWYEMRPAKTGHRIFQVREEGLTSMALKLISLSNCSGVRNISMVSSEVEKTAGYDFQISIGSDRLGNWVNFFIQAKRLDGFDKRSLYKDFKIKQCKNLIAHSKWKAVPLYCLYNHIQSSVPLKDCFHSVSKYNRTHLGISLISAIQMQRASALTFEELHSGGTGQISKSVYAGTQIAKLFHYYRNQMNLAVPFHELAYFKIRLAREINARRSEVDKADKLNLLLLLLNLSDEEGELIPILKTNSEEIISEFNERSLAENISNDDSRFQPSALLVIDTGE